MLCLEVPGVGGVVVDPAGSLVPGGAARFRVPAVGAAPVQAVRGAGSRVRSVASVRVPWPRVPCVGVVAGVRL